MDQDRREPAWYFSPITESKQGKNRHYLDLVDTDPAVVARLVGLGATVVDEHRLDGTDHSWTVVHDPEGNEFCLGTMRFTGWAWRPNRLRLT